MMRVLALSDLHGYLPEIPKCDLLLLGGDYCDKRDKEMQLRYMQGPFKKWLEEAPARHKVAIAGNHDRAMEEWPDLFLNLPWVYLQDELVVIEGIRIYGTPWTPRYGDWAFMKEEWKLEHIFGNIPANLDILLSHGPAFNHLDLSVHGDHCGSRCLQEKIRKVKPDSVVHGHIHEAHGIEEYQNIRYFNVAYVDHNNEPKHEPVEVPLRVE